MTSRPASHYLTALYLLVLSAFIVFVTSYFYVIYCRDGTLIRGGTPSFVNCRPLTVLWPLIFAIPPITAVIALFSSHASWVRYLIGTVLLAYPAYLVAHIGHLIDTGQSLAVGLPLALVGIGCLLWLFIAYVFGRASRAFYERS